MTRQIGFTLAEVLITLGIIGVVCALTIPSLIQKHQERAQIIKLKKVYSILNTAFNTAIAENGDINSWSQLAEGASNLDEQTIAINNIMKNYFNYTKYCDFGNKNKCQSPAYRMTNGEKRNYNIFNGTAPKYFLADGTIITIQASKGDYTSLWCKYPVTNLSSSHKRYMYKCGKIYVDTNGFKGPNRDGFDIFAFVFYQNTITPLGLKNDHSIENFKVCTETSNYGFSEGTCTAWALQNENMDYLHCPKELSWDGKRSCK